MPLLDVVRFVGELVEETGIQYVVIGGFAVSTQVKPRATEDVDLIVLIGPERVDAFLDAIEKKGLSVSKRPRVAKALKAGSAAKIIWDSRFSFDLRIANFTLDDNAINAAEEVRLDKLGVSLRVATPEDLIVYKLARYEPVDHADIKAIVSQYRDLNWEYVREQAEILNEEWPGKGVHRNLKDVLRKYGPR